MKLFSDNLKIEQIPETELIQIGFKLKQFVEYYRKIDLDVANDYERFYNEIIKRLSTRSHPN